MGFPPNAGRENVHEPILSTITEPAIFVSLKMFNSEFGSAEPDNTTYFDDVMASKIGVPALSATSLMTGREGA